MKKLFLLPLLFCFSCNCTKLTTSTSSAPVQSKIETVCPDDGTCTLEFYKNKEMVIVKDGIGTMSYKLQDNPNTSVVYYQYKRTTDPALQDASHREEIVFEIENNASRLDLNNGELQQTKMLFGRHCFCRGQAGYFRVVQGTLHLNNEKGVLDFALDYKIKEVPQTLTQLKGSFKQ
ncbi:hypothetical protein LZZ90_11700 [Flavobacterium sp. SM15]|uniref:hypothetical protein n=1 Tax=Flavobacterium sp. SM15 TaxID=2908005 RepID=UPI001EDAA574|nr:hypothetical protein [Flavobacterium sp. SM15]MCG2612171.1 hypothetical protein [Flavobacterium sp. SM15]